MKSDGALHQVYESQDGEEKRGLTVFTAWNEFLHLFSLPSLLSGSFRSQFL